MRLYSTTTHICVLHHFQAGVWERQGRSASPWGKGVEE